MRVGCGVTQRSVSEPDPVIHAVVLPQGGVLHAICGARVATTTIEPFATGTDTKRCIRCGVEFTHRLRFGADYS